jgi:hypothetical protein
MHEDIKFKHESTSEEIRHVVAEATERARFKNARLRHLKERNDLYLAARRIDPDDIDGLIDDEVTKEL